MGKKRSRSKLTSKGVHSNVNRGLLSSIRMERTAGERLSFKIDAWKKMKNPWLTVDTGSEKSNMRFKRVRANDHWGSPVFKAGKPE